MDSGAREEMEWGGVGVGVGGKFVGLVEVKRYSAITLIVVIG